MDTTLSLQNYLTMATSIATILVPDANNMIIYNPKLFSSLKNAVSNIGSISPMTFLTGNVLGYLTAVSSQNVLLGAAVPVAYSVLNKPSEMLFRFALNPQNLKVSRPKIQKVVLTKAGFEHHYVREAMVNMSYTGKSGYLEPPSVVLRKLGADSNMIRNLEQNPTTKNMMSDLRLSPAWLKFQRFEEFYNASTEDLVMIFDGIFYQGIFAEDGLHWSQDASNPAIINYDFTFLAYPDKVVNLFSKVPAVITAF